MRVQFVRLTQEGGARDGMAVYVNPSQIQWMKRCVRDKATYIGMSSLVNADGSLDVRETPEMIVDRIATVLE